MLLCFVFVLLRFFIFNFQSPSPSASFCYSVCLSQALSCLETNAFRHLWYLQKQPQITAGITVTVIQRRYPERRGTCEAFSAHCNCMRQERKARTYRDVNSHRPIPCKWNYFPRCWEDSLDGCRILEGEAPCFVVGNYMGRGNIYIFKMWLS